MTTLQTFIKPAINRYLIAQMFLTRIPGSKTIKWSEGELAASTPYFPAVGIVIGIIASTAWFAGYAGWGPTIAALFAVTAAILATGAFHEDGLADSADGIGGAFEIEKKLSIMRDSRIGTYGSVALIVMIIAKVLALALIEPGHVVATLITAHVVSRWTSLPLIYNNDYVREQGTGKPFAATVTKQRLLAGTVFTLFIVVLCIQVKALIVVAVIIFTLLFSQWYLRRKLGGITGDVLGAVNSLTELIVYLTLSAQFL